MDEQLLLASKQRRASRRESSRRSISREPSASGMAVQETLWGKPVVEQTPFFFGH